MAAPQLSQKGRVLPVETEELLDLVAEQEQRQVAAGKKILEEKELPPDKETKTPEKKEMPEIAVKETAGIEKESVKKAEAVDEITAKTDVVKEKPEAEKPVAKQPEKPAALKKPKPKKVTKKRKKDTPAKIIKLPVPPPPKEKEPEIETDLVSKLEEEPAIKPELKVTPKDEPIKEPKKAKKKWTKKPDEGVTDRKFFKKKISFRKKEVVEGADLYAKGHRGRRSDCSALARQGRRWGESDQCRSPGAGRAQVEPEPGRGDDGGGRGQGRGADGEQPGRAGVPGAERRGRGDLCYTAHLAAFSRLSRQAARAVL